MQRRSTSDPKHLPVGQVTVSLKPFTSTSPSLHCRGSLPRWQMARRGQFTSESLWLRQSNMFFVRLCKTCAFADDLSILKDLAEIPISAGSIASFCA